jgi:hypothetical protein
MEPHRPTAPPLTPEEVDRRLHHRLSLLQQLWPAIDALLVALDAEEEDNQLAPHTITCREHLRTLVARYRQV